MLLLGKDAKGDLMVQDTGDRLGSRGASWGAGVGALAGLVLPPAFLASIIAGTAAGTAAGGIVGRFASHKLKGGVAANPRVDFAQVTDLVSRSISR